MNISSSIINHRLYFTHKLLLKLPHLDCFFPSGSTEHVNSLLGRRFKKRWHSCYVSPSRMGPDRNGRPKGNRKVLVTNVFLHSCQWFTFFGILTFVIFLVAPSGSPDDSWEHRRYDESHHKPHREWKWNSFRLGRQKHPLVNTKLILCVVYTS